MCRLLSITIDPSRQYYRSTEKESAKVNATAATSTNPASLDSNGTYNEKLTVADSNVAIALPDVSGYPLGAANNVLEIIP